MVFVVLDRHSSGSTLEGEHVHTSCTIMYSLINVSSGACVFGEKHNMNAVDEIECRHHQQQLPLGNLIFTGHV